MRHKQKTNNKYMYISPYIFFLYFNLKLKKRAEDAENA